MFDKKWYYWQSEPQLWIVGLGDGLDLIRESSHATRESASRRVAWLNGDELTIADAEIEVRALSIRLGLAQ
jgi:hypothetical protein